MSQYRSKYPSYAPSEDVIPAKNSYDEAGLLQRRAWLTERTGVALDVLSQHPFSAESVQGC